MASNRHLIKMCALVEEQMYLMIKLITNRDAEVSMHAFGEMLGEFKVGGYVHGFKRFIAEKELEVIRRLRTVAIRKNDN